MFYNASMIDEKTVAKIEAQLENLIEGVFTALFRKGLSAHDITLALTRAIDNSLRYSQEDDTRPIVADHYLIRLHPTIYAQFTQTIPTLAETLQDHILELTAQSDYRLVLQPSVQFVATDEIDFTEIDIVAKHSRLPSENTQIMQPIQASLVKTPKNPQLLVNDGERIIYLKKSLINVGRSDDNHIILDDAYCSRHHIQLRLRFGTYTLFDVNSRTGTFVNGVRVTEHQLQSGDVIQIGHTRLTYILDDPEDRSDTTQLLNPITI